MTKLEKLVKKILEKNSHSVHLHFYQTGNIYVNVGKTYYGNDAEIEDFKHLYQIMEKEAK